jgi:hypothetical protein
MELPSKYTRQIPLTMTALLPVVRRYVGRCELEMQHRVLDMNFGYGTTDPQLKLADSFAIAPGLGQRARPS